jgi:hypothetical protein
MFNKIVVGCAEDLLTAGVSARVVREAHCPALALPRGVGSESARILVHETVAA